jgi:hypothetical protein
MTNGSFISTSIKTGIVLQLMTINKKKKKQKERNRIEGNIIILKSVSYTRISFQIIL